MIPCGLGRMACLLHENTKLVELYLSDSAPHLSICVRPLSMPQSNKAPREPTVLIMPCSWANAVKFSFSRETTGVAALKRKSGCAVYINQIPKVYYSTYINSIILQKIVHITWHTAFLSSGSGQQQQPKRTQNLSRSMPALFLYTHFESAIVMSSSCALFGFCV